MIKAISLGRNESFTLRDGWSVKALEAIQKYGTKTFSREDGISILGIGANMVKSLKYWLTTGRIIENSKTLKLSEYGEALLKYDPYMTADLSWLIFHHYLVSDLEAAPVFYYVFHINEKELIDPDTLHSELLSYLSQCYKVNEKTLSKDIGVFFRTYCHDNSSICPEENTASPLVRLNIIFPKNKDGQYQIRKAGYRKGMYLLVFYLLCQVYSENFNIRDAFLSKDSPAKTFKISETLFYDYLREMATHGLIRLDRTAGLNTVYILRQMSINDIYELWLQEGDW